MVVPSPSFSASQKKPFYNYNANQVYHARRRSLLNKHRHKHQDHVELLSTATASFKQAPSSDDESNVRVINDPESNQVTFEVQELNPDYTSHTAHIEDSEELDSARASASHDLNAAGETVEAGVDADMTEEAEEPTRLDMEVRDARRMVAARQAGQLGTDVSYLEVVGALLPLPNLSIQVIIVPSIHCEFEYRYRSTARTKIYSATL